MGDNPTWKEVESMLEKHKEECEDGRAALYMPSMKATTWLAILLPVCVSIIALVAGGVYAYSQGVSANRERIVIMEGKVQSLEMSVDEIRHTTYKSRQVSEAVLEEIRELRREFRRR